MDMFNDANEIVEAINGAEDVEERKAAIKVTVGFALHEKDWMTSGVGKDGLVGKLTVSLLFLSIRNMGPKPKGGE
ncbi:hypothetical protein ES703_97793 [subsurface metagenome]